MATRLGQQRQLNFHASSVCETHLNLFSAHETNCQPNCTRWRTLG
jgi:hypothetical protein